MRGFHLPPPADALQCEPEFSAHQLMRWSEDANRVVRDALGATERRRGRPSRPGEVPKLASGLDLHAGRRSSEASSAAAGTLGLSWQQQQEDELPVIGRHGHTVGPPRKAPRQQPP